MKTVQDKDGNVVKVEDNTPCHPGKNGKLPVMLDAVKDKKIFNSIEAKRIEWEAKVNERALEKVINKRNQERGSIKDQWEYFIDNGYDALKARDDSIKKKYQKP